jgi:hypothetical protein
MISSLMRRLMMSCVNLDAKYEVKPTTLQIDGCACAVTAVEDGRLIYDWDLLVQHFHECENMKELDDEGEEGLTAIEWIEYNVVRAIPYYQTDGIAPDIRQDGKSVIYDDDEEED